jgi:heterodisulfide reductase subunit A
MRLKPKAVVIAACSKYKIFPIFEKACEGTGTDPSQIEIVNIRENCAWVHVGQKEATAKAKRLIYSALVKAETLEPVNLRTFKVKEKALVVGAGIAGIMSSLELANQGFDVYLVEQTPLIGGKTTSLYSIYPLECLATCSSLIGNNLTEALNHPKIKIYTYSEIKKVIQYPGGFKIKIIKKPRYVNIEKCVGCGACAKECPAQVPNEYNAGLDLRTAIFTPHPQGIPNKYVIDDKNCLYLKFGTCGICAEVCNQKAINFKQLPTEEIIEVGAVILATGFDEFDPTLIPALGYKKYPDVITQYELSKLLDPLGPTKGELVKPSDKKKPANVVIIQCVGSRDPETNSYCSQYCCMGAIKNASIIKQRDPSINVTILGRDIRAIGHGYEEYYDKACRELGVQIARGNAENVQEDLSSKSMKIEYKQLNGKKHALQADLVVLSEGMIPSKDTKKIAEVFNIKTGNDGFLSELDKKVSTIQTENSGIFICGASHGPKNIKESISQALAAALQASLRMTGTVSKVMIIPKLNKDACSGCGLCQQACPYEAITIKEDIVRIDEVMCRGCGLCASVCPNHAIDLTNFENEKILGQIYAVLTCKIEGPKPIIPAFVCEACGVTVLDVVGTARKQYPASIIPIYLPCLSRLSISHVLEALALGADAILIVGCLKERCHFEKGIETAENRVRIIRQILEGLGIPKFNIQILGVAGSMTEDFILVTTRLYEGTKK